MPFPFRRCCIRLRCLYSCAYIFASIAFRCAEGVTCLNSLRRHSCIIRSPSILYSLRRHGIFLSYYRSSFCRAFIIASTPSRQSSALECLCRQYRVFRHRLIRCVVIFLSFTILFVIRRAFIASCWRWSAFFGFAPILCSELYR